MGVCEVVETTARDLIPIETIQCKPQLLSAKTYAGLTAFQAPSIMYAFTKHRLSLFPMAYNDLYWQGVTISYDGWTLTKRKEPAICTRSCTHDRQYDPVKDVLRWCELCERWYHLDCLEESMQRWKMKAKPGPRTSVLRQLAALPVQRGKVVLKSVGELEWKEVFPISTEMLVWAARELVLQRGDREKDRVGWQDDMLEILEGKTVKTRLGFNRWDMMGVREAIDELVEDVRAGAYNDVKMFLCPGHEHTALSLI